MLTRRRFLAASAAGLGLAALPLRAADKKPLFSISLAQWSLHRAFFGRVKPQLDPIDFAKIAKEVGAILWVDMAHYAGLIAAGFYPSPIPHADVVTSTTHKTLRGPRGGIILMKAEHEKAINSAIFPGLQGGPLEHVIAAKAVSFKEAATPAFRKLAEMFKRVRNIGKDYGSDAYEQDERTGPGLETVLEETAEKSLLAEIDRRRAPIANAVATGVNAV